MPTTLVYSEVLKDKKIAQDAIAKILTDFQNHTGITVHGITITKLIGYSTKEIKVTLDIQL